ncbi:hypothetical protein AMQ84_20740 [Paenibacillus riograndensis]|uniref:Endonuclease GajA/Old nuclease/RecF-like AAA domain-containing protein n=1 Tax=Paenibacillus riograndensis TaxID=483937 RepID=A0A132TTL6_9BACL|nr:AAA family ATPase [Paenibacillus riograndensis]KWX74426.1 hypothetical protein AMQ84_20740 [Paenibacillus riograndensis]
MKLTEVTIENFRSIENATISFDPQCRVLVGKNEVGKTNILKALMTLNPDTPITQIDLREGLPEEEIVEKGEVNFIFTLEPNDKNAILNLIKDSVLAVKTNFNNMLIKNNKNTSLEKYFLDHFNEGLLCVNIPSGKRYETYWDISVEYEILTHWKRPKKGTQYSIIVDEAQVSLANYQFINIREHPEVPLDYLEDVTLDYINECLGSKVSQFVKANKPEALLWSYDDKYLLPSSIELSSFRSNPDYCLPLKSMFELAGVSKITEQIDQATSKNKVGFRNLLDRVAKRTTDHFRNVWSEYNNVEFVLSPNGQYIDAGIKDNFNSFELSQRSDGFKRFVCFLLFISAKVESEKMRNTLLLFDEPDLALHPSGQKYLREEMFKISKNNYIVYSTHSIFMIDKEEISRHLIVEKKQEKTNIKQVDESNFVDEEVIFNALGFSVFETLKNNNLIFEGWKDKSLFNLALTRVPERYKEIKRLKQFGMCHARGVKDIKHIANILELAGRNYIIISDNDNPAREKQEEFVDLRKNGKWKRYDELANGENIRTVEDFIKPSCFVKAIDKLRLEHLSLPLTTEDSFIKSSKTILLVLEDELRNVITDRDERRRMIENIKNEAFDNLSLKDIKESYYQMIFNLHNEIS